MVEKHDRPAPDTREADATAKADALATTIDRNISALVRHRQAEARNAGFQDRVAGVITRFAGSMWFVYLHLGLFGGWIITNLGWVPGVQPWDPTMVVLAMIASVEAIFISTFVLISQNRMAAADDKRADLDLQISLLNEHETSKLLALVAAVAEKLEVHSEVDREVDELKRDVEPGALLHEIESKDNQTPKV
jgi:uncharacterized membrane protein